MVAFFFLHINCLHIILTTMRHLINKHYDTPGGLLGHPTNVSSHPKPPVSKDDETMKPKYPYQILLENAPNASELDYQFEVDIDCMEWWEKMSPKEVIREVEEIRDRYTLGSGWVHSEEIEDGSKTAITQRNDLRKVVAHMKRKYKKHYGGNQ